MLIHRWYLQRLFDGRGGCTDGSRVEVVGRRRLQVRDLLVDFGNLSRLTSLHFPSNYVNDSRSENSQYLFNKSTARQVALLQEE